MTTVCRTCGFSHPEQDCPRWPGATAPEWAIRFWCGHMTDGAAYSDKPAGQVFCPTCGAERTVLSAWLHKAPANIVANSTCTARSGEAWCDRPAGHTGDHDSGFISWPQHATLDDVTAESVRKILGEPQEQRACFRCGAPAGYGTAERELCKACRGQS